VALHGGFELNREGYAVQLLHHPCDATGFDSATTPRGSGLQNMADRLSALGGDLDVSSKPGEGTTVTGVLPAAVLQPAQGIRHEVRTTFT
jgi:signal transduction histidine kinase